MICPNQNTTAEKRVLYVVHRLCPGRAFAEAVMWITMASVLAAYDILPVRDPNTGKDILPVVEYNGEIVK